jgi:hypothetical protein
MRTNNSIRRFAASALAVAVLGIGATASAQQSVVVAGDDDNDGGSRGPNAFLFNSGLITTGLSYTPALIVAVNSDRSEDKYLYAPFVGPWLDLGARDGEGDKVDRTLLVVDGVFQTIGAIQLIASFMFMDGDDDVASADESTIVSETAVAPARLAEDGYGFVAVGRF